MDETHHVVLIKCAPDTTAKGIVKSASVCMRIREQFGRTSTQRVDLADSIERRDRGGGGGGIRVHVCQAAWL